MSITIDKSLINKWSIVFLVRPSDETKVHLRFGFLQKYEPATFNPPFIAKSIVLSPLSFEIPVACVPT